MKKEKNDFETIERETAENPQIEREIRRRKAKEHRVMTTLDRIFGFLLATVLVVGIAGLGLVYVLEKGPSEALTKDFVGTMKETRRFGFMANIFLTEDEVSEIYSRQDMSTLQSFDASLIKINSGEAETTETSYAEDEDGDGIIYETFTQNGYTGYLITVLDPKRVFLGIPDNFGGTGLTLEEMVEKYGALGGINAGAFKDEGGTGLGGAPNGLTVVDGEIIVNADTASMFGGFNSDGLLIVGYFDDYSATVNDIQFGVSFGPILIMNGEAVDGVSDSSTLNPRTVIGQRSDGAVLMLVIDGRQSYSMGATYGDCVKIMLEHGAVNAINMDGGSSTCMYYEGGYVNRPSGEYGARPVATAFLFK